MFTFDYTTRDPRTGEHTVHTVTKNVYQIDAAYEQALTNVHTVAIDPRP